MLTVLDIGARGGLHRRWAHLPVEAVGLEADVAECERLNALRAGVRFLPYSAGPTNGHALLHVTRKPGCSSLLPPDPEAVAPFPYGRQFDVVKTVPVTTMTVDAICDREGLWIDVLKLDIQGAELDALKGATGTLARCLAVETEVEFNPIYQGQPLFAQVDTFLRGLGFMLLGLRRDYWRRSSKRHAAGGTLMHGDALYVHEGRLSVDPEKARIVFTAYKQFDRGIEVRSAQLWQRIAGSVMRRIAPHRQWRAWLDACCAPAADWHDPEEFF
jgi:FkbM family methyltransferase